MRVLVIGSGGREHALVWKLAQSPLVKKVFCAPGNGGIAELAECVSIGVTDVERLLAFAKDQEIDLTVVGPEAALLAGVTDAFEAEGLAVFGPNRKAAEIEGSKSFAKDLMARYGIPTGNYRTFTTAEEAKQYVREQGAPIVVKADGLAAGKGVTVARTVEEAEVAIERVMNEKVFGEAGNRVVIEEFLSGQEMSLMAFVDGETVRPMVISQDHKPVFDGDQGPNTGGMGAYSPVPQIPSVVVDRAVAEILQPVAQAMVREGRLFRGVLYAGLMVTEAGPKVIEFNARFGDPETQVVLPRLDSDLAEIMLATVSGKLADIEIRWKEEAAVCVVMASEGYPGDYRKGVLIRSLPESRPDRIVFHAGTKKEDDQLVTAGGRVLAVTALGADVRAAQAAAYETVNQIDFDGAHYRRDIAAKALAAEE
ncbi:phosphoribosylamine--glycine ligase [Polycladomyces subterraneus]|uniref:Phosphoribosylamine--glycine ligase n=1 Tax=Polycladomyces subterraneus TaxID=1016997 RepID=A0ABT8IPF4_9BACL|nr:phosphoribosylamine--glycine ligase [Polycladomyces subterraneus]MDN4594666.1 phosphoribosylamine--glycine ligase [Polycladomyces subterraneus]